MGLTAALLFVPETQAFPAEELTNSTLVTLQLAQASGNIMDVARGADDFSTLVAAIETAELDGTLSSEGPFTVFAPTNDAFAALPDGVVDALLLPENRDLLTEILQYHVVLGSVPSDELETGAVTTLNGGLAVRVEPDRVIVNNASVVQPDVTASNGVIHVINRVLIPPSVQEELATRLQDSQTSESTSPEQSSPEPIPGLW
jgi:uncharacterized surface protein with fasciclin (FAS1) repeats